LESGRSQTNAGEHCLHGWSSGEWGKQMIAFIAKSAFVRALMDLRLQRLIAWPFLKENSASYISKAFEFGRVFDYKWTVNWRMLDEETFASKAFANLLLTGHTLLLLGFLCTKWCRKEEGGVIGVFRRGWSGKTPVTADDIIFTMFSCNLIGIVFSRSLHYQFYSWYFHTLPYLVWQAKWEGSLTYTTAAK
jgi:alpha-1,3-mannosyltransferase